MLDAEREQRRHMKEQLVELDAMIAAGEPTAYSREFDQFCDCKNWLVCHQVFCP